MKKHVYNLAILFGVYLSGVMSALGINGATASKPDIRTEQEKRGLHAVEVQVDGYWCIVGYFGVDAKPVSIDCK